MLPQWTWISRGKSWSCDGWICTIDINSFDSVMKNKMFWTLTLMIVCTALHTVLLSSSTDTHKSSRGWFCQTACFACKTFNPYSKAAVLKVGSTAAICYRDITGGHKLPVWKWCAELKLKGYVLCGSFLLVIYVVRSVLKQHNMDSDTLLMKRTAGGQILYVK